MSSRSITPIACSRALARGIILGAGALALACMAPQGARASALAVPQLSAGTPTGSVVSATVEECATTGAQTERAATFTGEMTAVTGTARMAMRIDVEQRVLGEETFHTVSAPGLGVWRSADAKVKVYKYLKQVTNLSMPASYRGLVRFRWLNAKGRVIKRAERLTPRCLQPALSETTETNPGAGMSLSMGAATAPA
jgi:hypothetical protein